jgi:ketosteroid isomerase-like protein
MRGKSSPWLVAAVLVACTGRPDPLPAVTSAAIQDAAIDAEPIIAAERAFAAGTAARGWNAGVRGSADGDAIVLSPGPVNALSTLSGEAEEGGSPLQWWPAYAGIARSGDLGFTTGPFHLRDRGYIGNYFTVWRKQPDGAWKWIFDGGVDVLDDDPPAEDAPVERLPVARSDGESTAAALRAVEALDAALAAEAAEGAPAAITRRLSPDGRVNRAFLPRAVGLEAARETLAGHAAAIRFEPLGGAASRAGDLAFTYGNARWDAAEGENGIGYYARIWQLRPEGWQLVFDQIVPHRGPPPES